MNTIKIDGKFYPTRATMGAYIAFKRERGIDISHVADDIEAGFYFLYECVKSACRLDKIDFPYSYEEFADRIDLTELQSFQQQNGVENDIGRASKKK
jgi:hypothetical protein